MSFRPALAHYGLSWRACAHRLFVTLLAAAPLGLSAACQRAPKVVDADALAAVALPAPVARPRFTLRDTDGRPYAFNTATRGVLTLLFFGYTNCPDVCPVHLANVAKAYHALDYVDRQRLRVVFVTTDPARDSASALRRWLNDFDPAFVGLWGSEAEVDSAQRAAGLAPAVRGPKQPDGSYSVGHAGQILVVDPDDSVRVVYPFGTRQSAWVHDLPLLVHQAPATRTAAATSPSASGT